MVKLSNVVKNYVIKKTESNGLVCKINNIDTTGFVLKTKYDTDIREINKTIRKGNGAASKDDLDAVKNKIPNVSGFLLTSVFNSKITEVENKIPDIKNLASKSELTNVENKIRDVSNLFSKTEYATKISKIKNDYVTNVSLNARYKDLVQKATFESKLKKVDDKTSSNSPKVLSYEHKLRPREDTINDLERDASYFRSKNFLEGNYLAFKPIYKSFKRSIDSNNIVYVHNWQSNGLCDEKITAPRTSTSKDKAPILKYESDRIRLQYKGDLLKQNIAAYNHGPVVNIYIVYEISFTFTSQSCFTLKNYLFGTVKITKNSDISKYKYSDGCGISFDSKGSFLHSDGNYGVNVIMFGADLSSSTYANNRANNILVPGKDFIQEVNGTTVYVLN